jgi:hypothetical protein
LLEEIEQNNVPQFYGKTPFSAWEDVSAYIPRHLTLWEAFYPPFENETKMTR